MSALAEAERFARLRLARTERVGPVAFAQLLRRFGSAGRALDALPGLVRNAGASASQPPPTDVIEAELTRGQRAGARLLVFGDAEYPAALAAVDPPPPVLWTRGDVALMTRPCLAVVGARVASAAGLRIARGLAQQLGESGRVVVSGLARGVDAAAHQGALPTGTVAVLGGGVDDVYPPDNAALYARIVEEGCVVSESPVGARAQARDFPRRNRIISGLSLGVIVVEAELRSGSLITARLAGEQGRDVFAVPGSPLDPRSRGPNELLRQGAILCEGIEDVDRALPLEAPSYARFRLEEPEAELRADDEPSDAQLIERVAALLSPVPTQRDEVARALNVPVGAVAAALLELSLAGRAELSAGGLAARRDPG